PSAGDSHVFRGGSWDDEPKYLRSADRYIAPLGAYPNLGFRVLCELGSSAKPASKPREEGFVPLFNGKDLDSWKQAGDWRVIDGILANFSEANALYELLTTSGHYKDFHLRLEIRIKDAREQNWIAFRRPVDSLEGYQVCIGGGYFGALGRQFRSTSGSI